MKSDSDLLSEIQAELLGQFAGGAEAIDVQVLDGVVTLTGRLASELERWQLDDAIRAIADVRELINKTIVLPETLSSSSVSDTAKPWFPAR